MPRCGYAHRVSERIHRLRRLIAGLRPSAPDGGAALVVRPMEEDDKLAIADIGNKTTELYRVVGVEMPPLWADIVLQGEALAILVAGRPAEGIVRIVEKDGLAYITGIAVVPGVLRKGVGRALLDASCEWARDRGYPAITVSAFVDVSWNAPFFRAHGFEDMAELPRELAAVREWERELGLHAPGPRTFLRRNLT